jgi:tetratricopeptide (TPR) repeat protein
MDFRLGNLEEARRNIDLAQASTERFYKADSAEMVDVLDVRAQIQVAGGDVEGALASVEQSLAISTANPTTDPVDLAQSRGNASIMYYQAGRLDRALELSAQSLDGLKAALGEGHPNLINASLLCGSFARFAGKLEESEQRLRAALALAEKHLAVDHPNRVNAQVELSITLLARNKAKDALPHITRAAEIYAKPGGNKGNAAEAKFTMARTLRLLGRDPARARSLAEEAREAYRSLGPGYEAQLKEVEDWLGAR